MANIMKIYRSESSVQAVYDAMRYGGVESYTDGEPARRDHAGRPRLPDLRLREHGIRRRRMHEMFQNPTYDPLAAAENRLSFDPLRPGRDPPPLTV